MIFRYRPKGVFGKGVGNSQNASEMRQKCLKNASKWVLFHWDKRGTSKMRQKSVRNASKMRQKCAEHLWGRTPFGRYRILGAWLGVMQITQKAHFGALSGLDPWACWEEPSMDQCQCRGKLLKNFQDHWSIRISPGKGMDQ